MYAYLDTIIATVLLIAPLAYAFTASVGELKTR